MVQFYFNRHIHIVIEDWNKEKEKAGTLGMAQSALLTEPDCVCVCVGVCERSDLEEGDREGFFFIFNSLCWRCTTSGIFCHLIHFSSVANSQGIFSITEK